MIKDINYNKKILLNLDGYQLNVFLNPLKKILTKYPIKIALHCASIEDKKILSDNFSENINIYCYEEYVRENYNKIKPEEFDKVYNKFNLSIEEIDLAFEFYKKYYFHSIMSKSKKDIISKKRAVLYFNFYEKIFDDFDPDIVLHEHTGGTGSKILWNFCKKYHRDYYFIKGLYFADKFIILDHENFLSPFFDSNNLKQFSSKEIKDFKNKYLKEKNLAPFEINAKKINKIEISQKFKNYFKKVIIYKRNINEINYLLNRFPPIIDGIFFRLLSKIRKFIFTNFIVDKINLNKKFITVFLQVEPELTVYSLQHKVNINRIIKNISNCLPNDYYIYLKEHPSQHINSRFRSLFFFWKLKKIKNLKICKVNQNSTDLIKNSQFLISGGGTAAFESILLNKPCINYGQNFYLNYKTLFNLKTENETFNIVKKIQDYKNNKENYLNSENENINFAINVKNSMLDGYLFLSKNLKNSEIIEKNEKFLFDSLKKIFTKITNKN